MIKNKVADENGFVYTAGTASGLQNDVNMLRVRFEKRDLDGLRVEQFRKQGYEIENENEIIREEYEIQNKMIHIQSGLFSCGICLIALISGRKIYRYSL